MRGDLLQHSTISTTASVALAGFCWREISQERIGCVCLLGIWNLGFGIWIVVRIYDVGREGTVGAH